MVDAIILESLHDSGFFFILKCIIFFVIFEIDIVNIIIILKVMKKIHIKLHTDTIYCNNITKSRLNNNNKKSVF